MEKLIDLHYNYGKTYNKIIVYDENYIKVFEGNKRHIRKCGFKNRFISNISNDKINETTIVILLAE